MKNIFSKIKLFLLPSLAVILIAGYIALPTQANKDNQNIGNSEPQNIGSNFPDSKWLIIDKFQGLQTKKDPTKIMSGANANGQNTIINDGDRISSRNFGYTVIGSSTTTEDMVTSLHTFRKRDGTNILMRGRGAYLEYFEEYGDNWEVLISTATYGAAYGFADFNINTDLKSYVYFGNATNSAARWTGAITTTTLAIPVSTGTLFVADTSGFPTTGTVVFCGERLAYSNKTLTTFTVSYSGAGCPAGRGVAQAVEEFPANPRGNIYLVANNRLFIAGVTSTPQAVFFSAYGDAATWLTTLVSSNTAASAGIFNLGEGGGGVTGMTQDEGSIYIFKKNITYKATLSDSLYTLQALKPFDGKSQTTGNVNRNLIFTGGNGTFFVTPDKQVMNLARILQVDYPQITPISYSIQPTINEMDFTEGAGIFWKQSALISAKETSDSSNPNIVLVYNDLIHAWESPIVGLAANAWTIYDNGEGEDLYFGDANVANVYKITEDVISDNDLAFTSAWRSKQFDFAELGIPSAQLKEMDSVYVEGYISENTELTVSLLLDESGFTQQFTSTLDGSTSTYMYSAPSFNPFGLNPFAVNRFGSSDATGRKKFRMYLSRDFRAYPFYNAQIEFGSESAGQEWEVTSFGFKVRASTVQEKRSLLKSFK